VTGAEKLRLERRTGDTTGLVECARGAMVNCKGSGGGVDMRMWRRDGR
jgi:hypothetical protein